MTIKLCLCTGTSYKIKLCNFNTPNLSDTISTEDIWYPKLTWTGPEAGKIKLNSTPILLANNRKVLLGIIRPYSLVASKKNVPGASKDKFLLLHLNFFLQPMGNFLAHYSSNVICFDIKEYEELSKFFLRKEKTNQDTHGHFRNGSCSNTVETQSLFGRHWRPI